MFWQKSLETISRRRLEQLQLERLQQTVQRVYRKIPFYRRQFDARGLKPAHIRSLPDLVRLPFTTNADLRANYPAGFLAVPRRGTAIRLHTSSGTTGKPKALFFSAADINQAAELIARCLVMTGFTSRDVLQNMMTYGLFTGALMMHYGAEKVGGMVIPAGPGNSDRQLLLMQDFGTTTIHTTPSYALYLVDFLRQKGIDPRSLKLRRAYIGSEPYTEETRRKIEEAFGLRVYNSYGLSEMNGPGVAFECECQSGMHLWEDNYIMEIVDPATGRPVPEGQPGELILTTLCREAMPILRYRTRDITSIVPGKCACGRTHRRLHRITGRSDDMLIVRGVNIYPQQIERVLMRQKVVGGNYQIILDGLDEITVKVELAPGRFDGEVQHVVDLQRLIVEQLRAEIQVRPKVEVCPAGSLPVSEGKAKRVLDKRAL